MKSTKETAITKGSGNVFAGLAFSPAESRSLRIRTEMMTALSKHIESEGFTQAEAAKRLRVTQPRISDLARDKISRFSLDTLVNMLSDAAWSMSRSRPETTTLYRFSPANRAIPAGTGRLPCNHQPMALRVWSERELVGVPQVQRDTPDRPALHQHSDHQIER